MVSVASNAQCGQVIVDSRMSTASGIEITDRQKGQADDKADGRQAADSGPRKG